MRRVLLIHNPVAARTRSRRLQQVIDTLRRGECDVQVASTGGVGDAVNLAREGAVNGVDIVAVYGGDGTMMQAVQGIINHEIPIGLIPGGTGNLLAANLGLPRNPVRAAEIVATGAPRPIDLGKFESADGVRYFAVASGAGFDAQLMAGTPSVSKRKWGMGAYVVRAFRILSSLRPTRFTLVVDDETHEVRAASVLVANCGTVFPPILHLGADIALDDGALDVVILDAASVWQVFLTLGVLLRRRVDGVRVRRFRGRKVRVEADGPVPVQLDGEPNGRTPFAATILPGRLKVIVPAGGLPRGGPGIPYAQDRPI